MDRRKATVKNIYGVDNILRLYDKDETAIANRNASYSGVRNFSKSGAVQAALDVQFEKYGVTNTAHIPGAIEKAQQTNLERYGYVCPAHKEQQFQKSKRATDWLDSLDVPQREYQVPGARFVADGYNPDTNTLYEFFGNYWHGNPRMYEASVFNDLCKKTMGQLYQASLDKVSKLEQLGYTVVVVWEDQLY